MKVKWKLFCESTNETFELSKSQCVAGRHLQADIICVSSSVSRKHAIFVILKDGSLHLYDNTSSNGTYINNFKIAPKELHKLNANDEVGLGVSRRLDLKQLPPPHYFLKVLQTKLTAISEVIEIEDDSDDTDVDEKSVESNNPKKACNDLKVLENINLLKLLNDNDTSSDDDKGQKFIIEIKKEKTETDMHKYPVPNHIDDDPDSVKKVANDVIEKEIEKRGLEENTSVVIKSEPCFIVPQDNYSQTDDCIVIDDDNDEDNMQVCSQLLQPAKHKEHSDLKNAVLDDSIFCNIKQELEEMDKVEELPPITIDMDSDLESEWNFSNVEQTNNHIPHDNEAFNQDISPDQVVDENPTKIDTVDKSISYPSTSNKPSTSRAYIKPPIIEPHHTSSRQSATKDNKKSNKEKIPIKRKSTTSPTKKSKMPKIDINKFYKPGSNNFMTMQKRSNSTTETLDKEEKEKLQNIRRKKLKEIANKQQDAKLPNNFKSKIGTAKVKVSDSRGKFLLNNDSKTLPEKPNSLGNEQIKKRSLSVEISRPLINPVRRNSSNVVPITSHRNKTPGEVSNNYVPKSSATSFRSCQQEFYNVDVKEIIRQIVTWSTLWFQEQKYIKKPPPVNKHPAVKMCKKFSSYADYQNVVVPLLLLESWDSLCKDYEGVDADPRKKVSCFKLEVQKPNELYCLTYFTKEQFKSQQFIRPEDLIVFEVRIAQQGRIVSMPMLGYIEWVHKRIAHADDIIDEELVRGLHFVPDYIAKFKIITKTYEGEVSKKKPVCMRVLSSLVPFMRIFRSVKYLERSPLCRLVLHPDVEAFKIPPLQSQNISFSVKLNDVQAQAVKEAVHICKRDEPGIYLIQGPPGTGKTTVILSIIKQIFTDESSVVPKVILVCAPSNGAINELTTRLITARSNMTAEEKKRLKIVRVGPANMIDPIVKPYSVPELAKMNLREELLHVNSDIQQELISLQEKKNVYYQQRGEERDREYTKNCMNNICKQYLGLLYNDKIRHYEQIVLSKATVICTTLSSCGSASIIDTFGKSKNGITCCIVDEATQGSEPETLIPLALKINKLILVGDPQQLPATAMSMEAKRLGYDQSLFTRIKNNFEGKPNSPIKMLNVQYRMHPEICMYPNETFYGGNLQTVHKWDNMRDLKSLKPYMVFNLNIKHDNQKEYHNEHEINFVLMLVEAVIGIINRTCKFSIGIITPYNTQKDALTNKLSGKSLNNNVSINVNTVDSFQGKERDVIIMSCVRFKPNSFLSDKHRLNVAITRAKHALYIVGTDNLLQNCAVLGDLRRNAETRNLLLNVNNKVTSAALKQLLIVK